MPSILATGALVLASFTVGLLSLVYMRTLQSAGVVPLTWMIATSRIIDNLMMPSISLNNCQNKEESEDDGVNIRHDALLQLFAYGQMDWTVSTTPVPISAHSPVMKQILAGNIDTVPPPLHHLIGQDTIHVSDVRQYLNYVRYARLIRLCHGNRGALELHDTQDLSRIRWCYKHVNDVDKDFGMSPLHYAYYQGDWNAVRYLIALGADIDLFDKAGRKPANLSYTNFVHNTRKWTHASSKVNDLHCELPTIDVTDPLQRKHIARLVNEGEPILIRNFLQLTNTSSLLDIDLNDFVDHHGDTVVNVGEVPYSDYFGLPMQKLTLKEFYNHHVLLANDSTTPLYIFQKNDNITAPYLSLLDMLVQGYFSTKKTSKRPLICPPSYASTGAASIHYFLGASDSGAPFHIHSDAINLSLQGLKHWYILPPLQALYSRKPIRKWINEDLPLIPLYRPEQQQDLREGFPVPDRDIVPLKCVQQPGDIIYLPFDWSHAVLNKGVVLGVALEVLNRRDTYASVSQSH